MTGKSAALILAKGHSSRLKNKNTLDFDGKPMFLWSVEKCLKIFDHVYVSSDSKDILHVAELNGAIPILRGKTLAGDCPNIPVYQHALKEMYPCDYVVAVQACSPAVNQNLLGLTKQLMDAGAQEVMTCHPMEPNEDYHAQGFKIYGSIWAIDVFRLKHYGDPYKPTPNVLLVDDSVDIHTQEDFDIALWRWTHR